MNTKVKCPFCEKIVNIFGRPHDLPLWNFSTGGLDKENKNKVMLIHCEECETILGSYKI